MSQYKPRHLAVSLNLCPYYTQTCYLQNSYCWYLHIVTLTLYIKLPEITIFKIVLENYLLLSERKHFTTTSHYTVKWLIREKT